jgi:hypothetical protein
MSERPIIPLAEQIAFCERLATRKYVMTTPGTIELNRQYWEAIWRTLQWIERNEAVIRAAVKDGPP